MRCIATTLSLCAATLFWPITVLAQIGTEQATSGTTSDSCVQRPDGTWVPCGPDRTLSEAEVRTLILREKDGLTAKVFGTSGTSGKQFFINIAPGGKLESGLLGGRNVGKSWKFESGKLCRSYYAPVSDVHCGVFEVADGNLYLLDIGDVKRSLINRIDYVKP